VLHGAVSGVMDKTGMLPKTVALVDAARAAGVTIMHAPITFAPGYGELSRHPYGILKGVVDGNAFVKGTWGAAIVDDLTPAEGDIIIEGKRGLDTFASTNLDFILRSKGIETVIIGGFLTNCCVESTMRSAYENGYRVNHADRLHRGHLRGGARQRDRVRLPDVLAADGVDDGDRRSEVSRSG